MTKRQHYIIAQNRDDKAVTGAIEQILKKIDLLEKNHDDKMDTRDVEAMKVIREQIVSIQSRYDHGPSGGQS